MKNEHDLKWQAALDRRLVSRRGGKRHLLVDITAPRARTKRDDRIPLNLGLVIDASGSMQGKPLEAARQAAIGIVEALRDEDHITVVSFASDVTTHADAVAADTAGKRAVITALEKLRTHGCTDLGAGWLRGCECVARQMDAAPHAQHRVILISDGHANRGITDPEQLGLHAAELRVRGLYSSAVGVGDHYSPTQLLAIAENGSGRLHDAADGQDLVEVVLGELGEILVTAAEDVTLRITHPVHMPVRVLGTYPCRTGRGELTVSAGTLVSGANRQVVLQIDVPPGREGDRLPLSIAPSWRRPGQTTALTADRLYVEIQLVPVEEVAAELPDIETCTRVANLWHKDILHRSMALNAEGDREGARRYIEEILPEFKAYCRDLPECRWLWRQLSRQARIVGEHISMRDLRASFSISRKMLCMEPDLRSRKSDPFRLEDRD